MTHSTVNIIKTALILSLAGLCFSGSIQPVLQIAREIHLAAIAVI
jgi:hypothetical protein